MFKLNSSLTAGAALSAVLLSGCGGDSGVAAAPPPGSLDQTVTAVVEYIQNLIASNGENTDPIDINRLTLAVDDTSEPAPLQ